MSSSEKIKSEALSRRRALAAQRVADEQAKPLDGEGMAQLRSTEESQSKVTPLADPSAFVSPPGPMAVETGNSSAFDETSRSSDVQEDKLKRTLLESVKPVSPPTLYTQWWEINKEKVSLENPKVLVGLIALVLLLVVSVYSLQGDNKPQTKEKWTLDSVIPAGATLYPIDIANYQSINAILGVTGVVDLYIPAGVGSKNGVKVGSRLRIVRATGNRANFAVVVPEGEVGRLMAHPGPFNVVVRSSKEVAGGIVQQKAPRTITVH